MGQDLNTFKATPPAQGEAKFLHNNLGQVVGMTISVNDCNGSSRIDSIGNLTTFTVGDFTVNTVNGQAYSGYFYYDVSPYVYTGSIASIVGACTNTSLTPPPKIDTFRNSQFNIVFNNATEPRRIQQTGSQAQGVGGVFEIDRKDDQIIPQNLNAILTGSATTASFQESNLYAKSWVLPRYEGSKLDSGSLYLNDPALSFTAFQAAKFDLFETSSLIRSKSFSDLDMETFYFNPPFLTSRPGMKSYFQGSVSSRPPINQPVYELEGKDYKRLTRSKLYIPNIDEIIKIVEDKAAYEINPADIPSASNAENIFLLEFQTLSSQGDTIYYWTSDRHASTPSQSLKEYFIRPGDSEELIVSGTYLGELGMFDTDAPASDGERLSGIYSPNHQPWQSTLGREKTYVSRIISRSIDA